MHFIFRYLFNGKIFEADGRKEHMASTPEFTVREAISREIKLSYESAMAGHIDWNLTRD